MSNYSVLRQRANGLQLEKNNELVAQLTPDGQFQGALTDLYVTFDVWSSSATHPTGRVRLIDHGNYVTGFISPLMSAGGATTGTELTAHAAIPAALRPTETTTVVCYVRTGTIGEVAVLTLGTDGSISFGILDGTSSFAATVDIGWNVAKSFSYLRTPNY